MTVTGFGPAAFVSDSGRPRPDPEWNPAAAAASSAGKIDRVVLLHTPRTRRSNGRRPASRRGRTIESAVECLGRRLPRATISYHGLYNHTDRKGAPVRLSRGDALTTGARPACTCRCARVRTPAPEGDRSPTARPQAVQANRGIRERVPASVVLGRQELAVRGAQLQAVSEIRSLKRRCRRAYDKALSGYLPKMPA